MANRDRNFKQTPTIRGFETLKPPDPPKTSTGKFAPPERKVPHHADPDYESPLETRFPVAPGLKHLADSTPSNCPSHDGCRTQQVSTYQYHSVVSEITNQNAKIRNERVIRAVVGPHESISEVALGSIFRRFTLSDEKLQTDVKNRTAAGEGRYSAVAIYDLFLEAANNPKSEDKLSADLSPLIIAGLANAQGTLISPRKYARGEQQTSS
jgi:hypothetical protein